MPIAAAICLGTLSMELGDSASLEGTRVFAALVELAERAATRLHAASPGVPIAVVSRLRGTGRGISSGVLLSALERDHPLEMLSPFEGSDRVAGAAWRGDRLVGPACRAAVARLRWDTRADDLPMHVHDHSDRFIIVREGRGYFHVSDEPFDGFTGTRVRSIPARERDVFLFTRGIVHTFSTADSTMTLFSCQLPYVDFDAPEQYRIPALRWTAASQADTGPPRVACDAGWSVLASQPRRPLVVGDLPASGILAGG